MVAAWPLPLLLLSGLAVGNGEHAPEDAQRCTDGSCKLEDELSLLQIKSDTVQRTGLESSDEPAPAANPQLKEILAKYFQGQASDSNTMILVQWRLEMDNRKGSKYLFFKNRWW